MFREQNLVEHANRQFKGPLAVRPIFLHSPERVEALLFVLMIALMIDFLIQRTYRENTDEEAPQTERRITTATILKSFLNYTVLIHHHAQGREVQPTRLSESPAVPDPRTNAQPQTRTTTRLTKFISHTDAPEI